MSSETEVAQGVELARPKVSLCIPAFQAGRFLRATIDSVLAQDFSDMEIVVVDNNSTDETRLILDEITDSRVRVITNRTTLPAEDNHNLAVKLSRGEFVKVISADDTLRRNCVAAQAAVLESNPDIALVASRTDFIDDAGALLFAARGLRGILGRQTGEQVIRRIVRSAKNPVGAPVSVMFRRADFDRCGGFRGPSLFTLDMDLWTRLLRIGHFYGMPETLAAYRIQGGSLTASISARTQLAQQDSLTRRIVDDPYWRVPHVDRLVGKINRYDVLLKRTVLFKLSSLRAFRQRLRLGWRWHTN
ncbi:glycosyl transferase family 2 [Mycolicibacterium sphagni]|uniref:Glycosyl transferase family 2 n=1 Tax=Mycolicibacterium sphagni TaxID=1786 RepID=A0A255DKN9_9MYCO|nr:glycosyltransferase [Mycolicibacterium sphagni]OYN80029.1 glycosyl transferase family 2 [Mycolicibacterium sphagni]